MSESNNIDDNLKLYTVIMNARKSCAHPQRYEFLVIAESEDEGREIVKNWIDKINIIDFYNVDVIYINLVGFAVKGSKKGIKL